MPPHAPGTLSPANALPGGIPGNDGIPGDAVPRDGIPGDGIPAPGVPAGSAILSGWGRYPVRRCRVAALRRPEDLPALMQREPTLIPRGNGRSYGDAALNPGLTLNMPAMNRMLDFDPATGRLTCEAGALLSDILDIFVPRGWFPPVAPGTRFVTVGGMIAADVHGKNHPVAGSFGAHLESLTLAAGDGLVRICSPTAHPDLFHATIGGMGLTGVILAATFRLMPITSAYVGEQTHAARDLDEIMALLASPGADARLPYRAAWVDCLARGAKLGRGLVSSGQILERSDLPAALAPNPLPPAPRPRLTAPARAPSALLNRPAIRLYNALRYRRGAKPPSPETAARIVHFAPFFFPLDGIANWNRLYGRRGLVQYQCALPEAESPRALALLLQRAARTGPGPFLGVLKRFGPAGSGLMSFPMPGYTLALDFPGGPDTLALLAELDDIAHAHGGRVYLAKDAAAAPERVRQGYPRLPDFQATRARWNGTPERFTSALARRLQL